MTMNISNIRYCHQIQISTEKVKREGGDTKNQRALSTTDIYNGTVYTLFTLKSIHAVECSRFSTSFYRQWSCSNI